MVKSDDCVVSAHIPASGLSIIWLGLVSTPPYVEFQLPHMWSFNSPICGVSTPPYVELSRFKAQLFHLRRRKNEF